MGAAIAAEQQQHAAERLLDLMASDSMADDSPPGAEASVDMLSCLMMCLRALGMFSGLVMCSAAYSCALLPFGVLSGLLV